MNVDLLQQELERDEGKKYFVYNDSLGYATLGIGRCVDARKGRKLSEAAIAFLFQEDLDEVTADLNAELPWWAQLDDVRQRVLANMCFELGIEGLQRFVKFLAAMQSGDWKTAAAEMQNSLWWGQVPARAARLQYMVLNGTAYTGEGA